MKKIKIYHNEIWKKIYYKGQKTDYFVSNKGRVKNRKTGKILRPNYNKDGYCSVVIRLNKKPYTVRVNRLVAMAFIPNPENKPQVNHKDGVRDNNKVENLEWMTASENTLHSFKYLGKQVKKGTESHFNIYPEEFIRKICSLLQEGYKNKEILNKLNLKDDKYRALIQHIINGDRWKEISKEYDFSNYYNNIKHIDTYTEEHIRYICELLEKGDTNMCVARKFIKKYNEFENETNVSNQVSIIRRGIRWKNISKDYVFPKQTVTNSDTYTEEHIRYICELLEKGETNVNIAKKLMVKYNEFNNFKNICAHISKIRRRRKCTKISKDYDF